MSNSLRPHESQHTTPGGMVLIHKSQIFGRLYFSDFVTHIWENVVVHLDSHVRLFATPWTAACQSSLSITNSQSSPKIMCIELVMASNHLILCRPLLLLPPVPPSIRVFSKLGKTWACHFIETQLPMSWVIQAWYDTMRLWYHHLKVWLLWVYCH